MEQHKACHCLPLLEVSSFTLQFREKYFAANLAGTCCTTRKNCNSLAYSKKYLNINLTHKKLRSIDQCVMYKP